MNILLFGLIAFLVTTVILLIIFLHLRSRTNIGSRGSIVASDVAGIGSVLYSQQYRLYGKPDYVVEEKIKGETRLVPVELKPSRKSKKLHESDELQLVVYLLLLQENFPDRAAPFGRVVYAPDIPPFTIKLTQDRLNRVLRSRDKILANRLAGDVKRDHQSRPRCLACGFKFNCRDSLA